MAFMNLQASCFDYCCGAVLPFFARTWDVIVLCEACVRVAAHAADWGILIEIHYDMVVSCPGCDGLQHVHQDHFPNEDCACHITLPAQLR